MEEFLHDDLEMPIIVTTLHVKYHILLIICIIKMNGPSTVYVKKR